MRSDRVGRLARAVLLLAIGSLVGCSPAGQDTVPDPTAARTGEAAPSATSPTVGPGPTGPGPVENPDEQDVTVSPGEPDLALVSQALTGAAPVQWRLSVCSERLGITSADEGRGRPLYLPCADEGPLELSVARIVDTELDVDEVVRLLLEAPTDEEALAGFQPVGSPSVEFATFVTADDVLVMDVVGSQEARVLVEFSIGRRGLLANLMTDDHEDVALLVDGVPFCRNMGGC